MVNISGKGIRWIYKDGHQETDVTVTVGKAILSERDISTINRLVQVCKGNPAIEHDLRKPAETSRREL